MADTVFDRTERGLGSTNLSVANIVAKTRGNPNEIMKLVMGGQINLTQGLLAKRLSDSVVAEQQKAAMPQSTVLQDQFPQLAQAMGGLQPPANMPPPMQGAAPAQGMGPVPPQPAAQPAPPPQGMAEGGLAQLDFDAPDYAGGGIVAFAGGGNTDFHQLISRLESGNRDYYDDGRPVVSSTGARYGMQVMPTTARSPGFGVTPARDDSPEEYNRVGREYADMLLERYGNETDALVAYNWGPGNADRWVASGRDTNALPEETRQYLARAGRSTGEAAESGGGGTSDVRSFLEGIIGGEGAPAPINPAAYLEQLNASNDTEAMDRYRARLEEGEDPERARQRAELGSLFEAIGNVRAGMSPLEALAQGFATSGTSMQEAEEAAAAEEMDRLRAVAEIEQAQNTLSRENYQLAVQLAQYDAGRIDAALGRRLEIAKSLLDVDTQVTIERARTALRHTEIRVQQQENELDRQVTREGQDKTLAAAGLRAAAEGQGGSFQDQILGFDSPAGGGGASAGAGRIVSAVPIPQ